MAKTKKIPFPFAKRPVCSCGVKMKLVKYQGYYDSFNYWCCENCTLDNEIQKADADNVCKGSYA